MTKEIGNVKIVEEGTRYCFDCLINYVGESCY